MKLSTSQWKINGQTITALGLDNVSWSRENQQAESISWLDPLAQFDADPRWGYDDEIVLTCNGVVKQRARIRNNPRNLDPGNENIQSSTVDCKGYANVIRVGYSHQLGIDDLKDMYRSNKNREPVTTTRNYNPAGGAQQAGLAIYNPRNDVSSTPIPPFQEKASVTPAGAIATKEELIAAIKARYEALNILPLPGQWIDVTIADKGKFRAIIWTSDSNLGGQWHGTFQMTKDGITIDYWVTLSQLGIY